MDCTLAVEDAAYNSGRRSRSTSFHSQARDGTADGPDAAKELSPHVKDNFTSNLFLSHRRHASELSDVSALYPNGSEHAVDLADHSQLDLPSHTASPSFAEVFSPSLTTKIDTFDDAGLDEAFTSSLLMSEGYSRPMNLGQHLDQNSIYQAASQPFSNTNRGSRSAVRPGSNNLPTSSRSGLLDPNVSSQINSTMSSSIHGGNYAPLYHDEALLQAGLAHMGGAYVDYRSQSFGSSQPNVPDGIDFGYDQSTMHFNSLNTAPMLEHRASLQSPQSAMLNVPGLEGMAHNSLEVPSPYSDGASYDGSSFEDPHSPVVDPLTLSRTNSYNSQFQPPFETHLVSAPTSPFPPHLDYSNVQQFSPLADYDSSFNGFPISAAPQYGFLQPPTAAQGHTSQDYGQRASLSIPGALQSTSFDAPDISINPPSPNNNSFNGRSDLAHYPFPQQVPHITTTNVPTSANGPQVNESQNMLQVEKYRGRSNSDSRLMVQPHTQRSRSHSSHDSSSSSRAPSRSGTPGIHHKPGTSKISKSFDHQRRASWSGARDHIEEDYSTSLSPNKQKSPATFICPIEGCHKAFTRAYNLRSHQRTHTNERPFLCESCGKGFARQHDRKRHEKLHTNEKPFSCPGCKKKFARMDALSRHFKSETGKDCIIGNPEYEHFLLEDGEGGGVGAGEED